jgi:hypothetical protein|tara:strand:+ start:9844 stop:10098 length:255 start_codon:yes stop_codon:yes gene_type:complete
MAPKTPGEEMTESENGSTNGWNEYSRLVKHELERLNRLYERLDEKLNSCRTEIATLKGRAGAWGAAAGVIGGAIAGVLATKLLG